jgi:tRNA-modifying protein YgfZ
MMNRDSYNLITTSGSAVSGPLPRALFCLTGEDRLRYLNGQITQDVSRIPVGQAGYGALLTAKGKIVSDLFVAVTAEALWLDVPLELGAVAQERIEKFLIADDAELREVTAEFRLGHSFHERPAAIQHIFANPRYGLSGFDFWLPASAPWPGEPIAEEVLSTLQIEHALAVWGHEIDSNTLPQEVLLERHGISFTKGCYTGQETVARLKSVGQVNRKLAFLQLIEGDEASPSAPLQVGQALAGRVTRVGFSPLLKKSVALALVTRQHYHPDQVFDCGQSRYQLVPPPRLLPCP